MSRSVNSTNARLFAALDDYCMSGRAVVEGRDRTRRIWLSRYDYLVVENAVKVKAYHFGRYRSVSYWELKDTAYVATIGFDSDLQLADSGPIDLTSAMFLLLAAEMGPRPRESATYVANLIGADRSGNSPVDKDGLALSELFPRFQCVQLRHKISEPDVERAFISALSDEAEVSGSWMEEGLRRKLVTLARSVPTMMPTGPLVEVLLDQDPRSLFMVLYRYLEGVYAYKASSDLRAELKVDASWIELARSLAGSLKWRPREFEALTHVLNMSSAESVAKLGWSLGIEGDATAERTAHPLYEMRNRLVHYSLGDARILPEHLNWNDLCAALCSVIESVYNVIALQMLESAEAKLAISQADVDQASGGRWNRNA
ncbi:hypothetical protein [Curtobacterium sp. VKM Ac-1395]|uniref:hypothetical protein n=1 Tax=Curtobacterium sp. VKM Ac-1395 TaxID=2783815 RepID=UPI00188CF1B4|nr:hypothetical protein [Curtobacterium sp. VKM Ac-1395]MBF4591605.1 hypothetical protein [Curtobacterium sp. VKM Ac-1395]